MRYFIVFFIVINSLAIYSNAQVSVVPPAIFVDPYTRSAEMYVLNAANKTQEISIELIFGYPALDSLGNPYMEYKDSAAVKEHSLANNLAIFPKKLELAPGKRQTVRFLLRNSGSLDEGVYWTRIKTTSQNIEKQIDSSDLQKVNVGVKLAFAMVTVIMYHKGKQDTKLSITSFDMQQDSSTFNMILDLERTGTAPFLGKTEIQVTNENGDEMDNTWLITPVYFSGKRRFPFNKQKYPPGKYIANFKFTNEIDEVPEELRSRFEPIRESFEFEIKE